MEVDEHHMWKDRTWLVGSSPARPSNLGMSEGSLVGIAGQPTSWRIGSFVNRSKSGKLRPTMKGSKGAAEVVPMAVPLVAVLALGMGLPLALGPIPDIVKATGGEPEVKGEPNESEEESECGLEGGQPTRN